VDLRKAWDEQAERWVRFARSPENDPAFWSFGLKVFLELLPRPGLLTVDLGCGEGRLPRILRGRGHTVLGLDGSPTLVRHSVSAEAGRYVAADAARAPLRSGCADLVTAYMSLVDVEDLEGAIEEAARILVPGGRFCFSIVHPMQSAGRVEGEGEEASLVIRGNYLQTSRYRYDALREGLTCSFHSMHRPLEAYTRALERSGLLIETLREPVVSEELVAARPTAAHHRRYPLFLFARAVKV